MFYDNFVNLCAAKGISPSAAAVEMGFQKSVVTRWKKNGSKPTDANLARVAEYFDVDKADLLKEKSPANDGKADDKLIAFYGECKPYLTKDDIDDIALFMRMKAERKKENGET